MHHFCKNKSSVKVLEKLKSKCFLKFSNNFLFKIKFNREDFLRFKKFIYTVEDN